MRGATTSSLAPGEGRAGVRRHGLRRVQHTSRSSRDFSRKSGELKTFVVVLEARAGHISVLSRGEPYMSIKVLPASFA